ncbi:MAG: hypothetical protein ACNYPI_08080 [Arenicellales bacterium WSBS_2016_MAG_OTU3]
MQRMIENELRKKGSRGNVKLGRGGIREIEFIAQSYQLVHGGTFTQFADAAIEISIYRIGCSRSDRT